MQIFKIEDNYELACWETEFIRASKGYKRYFTPDLSACSGKFHTYNKYWEIVEFSIKRNKKVPIGFFMLRGIGYPCPRLGVFIQENYSRKGLGRMALLFVESWCRLNKIKKLELTVHPKNKVALRFYKKEGYKSIGKKSGLGHDIYRKTL